MRDGRQCKHVGVYAAKRAMLGMQSLSVGRLVTAMMRNGFDAIHGADFMHPICAGEFSGKSLGD